MTTAGDLVTQASNLIHGGGSTQDRVTALAADIGPTDTTMTVTATFGQAVGLTPGLLEIDSELVYVTSADPVSGVCAFAPFGRGFDGTTATAHAAGARVISRPKFPRGELFLAINNTIGGLYPDLFGVSVETLTTAYHTPLPLGAAARTILACDYQGWTVPDWRPLDSYRLNRYDNSLSVDRNIPAGTNIRVSYATEPVPFTAETDDFSVTGLSSSCADLLVWGAVIKTTPGLDISRAQTTSVEQSARSSVVPPNAGLTASKYLYGLYNDRLMNEKRALRSQYPTRIVRSV